MKKIFILFVLIVVLSGIFYWVYTTGEKEKNARTSVEGNALSEEKILELLDNKNASERERILKTAARTPDQVIALHSLILKMTYGKELDKEQLKNLVDLQRMQYSEELLSQNEESNQQIKVIAGSEKQKQSNLKIVDYKALAPYQMDEVKYNGVYRPTVKVSVVYYTNVNGNNQYIDFLLYQDDKKDWKITGWAKGEEFLVSE